MIDASKPDRSRRVSVDGYSVVTYEYGTGDEVLFLLNGGPGLPCNYLRDPLLRLVGEGLRVVTYDQLGCGASDKPDDPRLWTIERYVAEVETVRQALGIERMHLLGHSWGGWLAIEYALSHLGPLASLILSNTCGDMPHLSGELDRLRGALGAESVAMMQRHEAEGTLDHPEYKAAIELLTYRHVVRLDHWPEPIQASLDDWNTAVYGVMQGPNEFLYVGNLKDWNRIAEMPRITVPTLVLVGEHDELTPACAMRMDRALPDSEIAVIRNASHMPFYEAPEAYFATLGRFLARVRG